MPVVLFWECLVWCVRAENIQIVALWRVGFVIFVPQRKLCEGWGANVKLCMGLSTGMFIHPLLTGISGGFRILNVYLTAVWLSELVCSL